ncbi:MAG: hypothetical protein K0Q73_6446 [Paenibacillus sp.]|jgi:hypothetical protein|nr:hypothetical protein [Paenibacillus sp.]
MTVFQRFEKYKKEGKSQGYGAKYKPGVTIRDIHSKGLSHRIRGWKTSRTHHFLSNLELHYFFTLEWALSVVDIREKYLLPPKETLDLAERLRIKHPVDIKRNQPSIITTDFLLDVRIDDQTRLFARSVIPKNRLFIKREVEKLELERMYWDEKGIDWGIITEEQISADFVRNIAWVHRAYQLKDIPQLNAELIVEIEPALFEELRQSSMPFPQAAKLVDESFKLKKGTCLWLIRHFIANRIWTIDMNVRVNLSQSLKVSRNENLSQVRRLKLDNYAHYQVRH